MVLHSAPRDVEGKDEQEHRDDEVVGYDARYQHIADAEEEKRKDVGCPLAQFDDLSEDAIHEDAGVEGAEQLHCHGDEEGAVEASYLHQSHVQQIWNVHVECQEWVAIYIIRCLPVAQHIIGEWVEARDVEVLDECSVVMVADWGEKVVIMAYHQAIEHGKYQEDEGGEPSLLFLDLEYMEYLFHCL